MRFLKNLFSIVDIETTGGNAKIGKITEIAIYRHNGVEIVNEFSSLVNPEIPIQPFVQRLTGIDNKMVSKAPKFHEIAKQVVEITNNSCFVAHNVQFDYSFLKAEFESLGYNFKLPRVCTVQLSRKFIPAMPSYSLGKLCKSIGIELNGRHRAAGDALATVKLFEKILNENQFANIKKHIKKA